METEHHRRVHIPRRRIGIMLSWLILIGVPAIAAIAVLGDSIWWVIDTPTKIFALILGFVVIHGAYRVMKER